MLSKAFICFKGDDLKLDINVDIILHYNWQVITIISFYGTIYHRIKFCKNKKLQNNCLNKNLVVSICKFYIIRRVI